MKLKDCFEGYVQNNGGRGSLGNHKSHILEKTLDILVFSLTMDTKSVKIHILANVNYRFPSGCRWWGWSVIVQCVHKNEIKILLETCIQRLGY